MKIKILNTSKFIPKKESSGASGYDLLADLDEPVVLEPLKRTLIPTGIFVEIPDGYEMQIRARSGLSIKHGLTLINGIGTIDSDYRGEIKIPLINLSDKSYEIKDGERIAQAVVIKYENVTFCEVSELSKTSRGEGGFGSTGK